MWMRLKILTLPADKKYFIYQLFKYSVYCLLTYNIYVFFQDELQASSYTFVEGITFANVFEVFSATIDTAAWVVLLLVFELETCVIPDEKLKGPLKWGLHSLGALCYLFICYAFYGYALNFLLILNAAPFAVDDVCKLAGTSFSYIEALDEYISISASNCLQLNNQQLFQLAGTNIISDENHLGLAMRLVTADMINAADWLLVVLVLQIDVWLQLKNKFKGLVVTVSVITKTLLYTVLFAVAVYWGYEGSFIDFWDAALWLVAFFFIEMNLFKWQEETDLQSQGT